MNLNWINAELGQTNFTLYFLHETFWDCGKFVCIGFTYVGWDNYKKKKWRQRMKHVKRYVLGTQSKLFVVPDMIMDKFKHGSTHICVSVQTVRRKPEIPVAWTPHFFRSPTTVYIYTDNVAHGKEQALI